MKEIDHVADGWVIEDWMGRLVEQVDGIPELIGREGIVKETFFDENGMMHCKCLVPNKRGFFWCPANLLKVIP